jgi:quinol monooxygenase YgiN
MMESLRAVATFPHISPENLAEFKATARELLIEVGKQNSILRYDLFFTADEKSCIVLEEYASAQAVIDHVTTNAEVLRKLMALGGKIEGKMFPLSQASQGISHIRENWDSTMHFHFAGK